MILAIIILAILVAILFLYSIIDEGRIKDLRKRVEKLESGKR